MSRLAQATRDDIEQAMINWIKEADSDTIERVWNENFNEEITYLHEQGVFEIPVDEAERNGIVFL